MRYIFFTLLLVLPFSARAIIPLELVAEFELPENATAWDVQHWMDDSTFGWAAVRNDSVIYAARLGDPVQAVSIDESYLDSIGHDFPPEYIRVVLINTDESEFLPSVVVVAHVENRDSSEYEDYDYDYYILLDLLTGSATPLFRHETHFDNDWLFTYFRTLDKVSVWPPLPAQTESVRGTYYQHDIYWSPYHITDDYLFFDWSYGNGSFRYRTNAGSYDFFSDADGGLVLGLVEEREGSTNCYRDLVIRNAATVGAPLSSQTTCTSSWNCFDEDPRVCRPSTVCAVRTRDGERRIVMDGTVYRASDFSEAGELPDTHLPVFSLRVSGFDEELLWSHPTSNSLRAWSLDLSFEDTTANYSPGWFRVLKHSDGFGEFVVRHSLSDSVRIQRPSIPSPQLSIAVDYDASLVVLRWTPFGFSSSYLVCRSQFPDGDFCEQDAISVADTFLTLPLVEGIDREFFRVKAVFD